MKVITQADFDKKVKLHALWVGNPGNGERLILQGSNLRGSDLTGCDLRDTDLRNSNFDSRKIISFTDVADLVTVSKTYKTTAPVTPKGPQTRQGILDTARSLIWLATRPAVAK